MTIVDFVVLLLIAGVCGAVGQALVGYSVLLITSKYQKDLITEANIASATMATTDQINQRGI